MTDCPLCGLPMAWSETHERTWCSVYGNHRERYTGPNIIRRAGPIAAVIQADTDRERRVA